MKIQIDGRDYTISYNIAAYEQAEKMAGVSIMSEIINKEGMIALTPLKIIMGCGLLNEDGNRLSPEHGQKAAVEYIQENGYGNTVALVFERIQEDMGFLFR